MVLPRCDERGERVPANGRNAHGYIQRRSVAERFDYDYPPQEADEIPEEARGLADKAKEVR